MSARPALIEFPADDPDRARRFWAGVLGTSLHERTGGEGEGWQTRDSNAPIGVGAAATGVGALEIGVHARGRGPGDTHSLPYFSVDDLEAALEQVVTLGGSVVHPGARWAICRDSEGSPFGLASSG